ARIYDKTNEIAGNGHDWWHEVWGTAFDPDRTVLRVEFEFDTERRTLLDEFLVRLDVFADHLEVEISGAGKLNVALHEVGLRNRSVEIAGVEGPT
ncbi:MAG: hypothetical protein CL424_04465, partial [Acidimicrobiaceae bacterium]|nr:hypothetical protein [Acidimicrobiaceae bacterium]